MRVLNSRFLNVLDSRIFIFYFFLGYFQNIIKVELEVMTIKFMVCSIFLKSNDFFVIVFGSYNIKVINKFNDCRKLLFYWFCV